jgi:ABC-type glutathione transport system ATPase component
MEEKTIKQTFDLLEVQNLALQIEANGDWRPVLKDINFGLNRGESIALLGDSGSGKSISVLTLLGLLPEYLNVSLKGNGWYVHEGNKVDLLSKKNNLSRGLRGEKIAMIFQDPMNALNPIQKCGRQVLEGVSLHRTRDKSKALEIAKDLFRQVGLGGESRFFSAYPHQLSGGQLQRVLIAIALSGKPELLIADEPTTNLDAEAKEEILLLLEQLRTEEKLSMIYITHDRKEAERMADRLYQVDHGVSGLATLKESEAPILTKFKKSHAQEGSDLIEVRKIRKAFFNDRGFLGMKKTRTLVLDQVDFTIPNSTTLGLVGRSGSGKTTLGRIIMNLESPDSGQVLFKSRNIFDLQEKEMRSLRTKLQIVYQNPYNTLNPRMRLVDIVREPLQIHSKLSKKEQFEQAAEMLDKVDILGEKHRQYMYQLSGGQRQRVAIARSLILTPEFIVLDECISSLDIRTQNRILQLLWDLRNEFKLSYLFISHDQEAVLNFSDRSYVLEEGRVHLL